MSYFTVGYRLPSFLASRLFGDRRTFGLIKQREDPCWITWQKKALEFYYENQKKSIGDTVNKSGYKVVSHYDFNGKKVLEIGPGDLEHFVHWNAHPDSYVVADIDKRFLQKSGSTLRDSGIDCEEVMVDPDFPEKWPFPDEEFDAILSFYSLEHLYPLAEYLRVFSRILKPGGSIVGAIPCEGGLGWGIGRYLTTRRWFLKNTTINPDKIICWEHPNFADSILHDLDAYFEKEWLSFWPLGVPVMDINLTVQFVYRKSRSETALR